MKSVLGLSMTSNSVGWVLLDGPGVDAATLDHGVFDVSVDDGDISKCITAVQGIQAIATTSGHDLKSIGLTWTADAAAATNLLLTSLPDLGFEKVVSVPLSEAASTWAHAFGAALGFERAALCVVEPSVATVLSFGDGAVRTFATHTRESDDVLSRWLKDSFEVNHVDPEYLFLIGSRGDVELISGRLNEALDMSVVVTHEAQLILARGTALMVRSNAEAVAVPLSDEQPATLKQNAAALAVMAGVIALFALAPMLKGQPETPSTRDQPASISSETSASIQAVPASPTPPSKNVVVPMVQPAPAPLPPSAPSPPVAEVSAPEAPIEPLAGPETPAAAVPSEAPAVVVPEGPAAEVPAGPAAEVPAAVPHLPDQTADVQPGSSHLPAEGAPHLPGAAPALAAEAPMAETAPAATTPTHAASSPALP